jgi:hypothetical protein
VRAREFLEILSLPRNMDLPGADTLSIQFDCEWLAIMKKTHSLTRTSRQTVCIPHERNDPSPQEIADVENALLRANGGTLIIENIDPATLSEASSLCHDIGPSNPQTDFLLSNLGLPHIWTRPRGSTWGSGGERMFDNGRENISNTRSTEPIPGVRTVSTTVTPDANEICLDDI